MKHLLTVLFHTWSAAFDCPGGGEIQLLQYEKHLIKLGIVYYAMIHGILSLIKLTWCIIFQVSQIYFFVTMSPKEKSYHWLSPRFFGRNKKINTTLIK